MDQNLSSGALVRPLHKDARAEADIPAGYGKTDSFLWPKDPAWLFLFWEITVDTLDCIKSQYGEDTLRAARTVIRLHDVTDLPLFDGTNDVCHYEQKLVHHLLEQI